jgi:hypothetical protein
MHLPINVKSPNNISKWQMGINSAFKGLKNSWQFCLHPYSEWILICNAACSLWLSCLKRHCLRNKYKKFNSYREKPNKMQKYIKILLFLVLHEAQNVSGNTPTIIRSLKLHWQPLVLQKCKTRGCQCSFRLLMMVGVLPETCWASFKIRGNKIWYTVASCWGFSL